MKKKYRIFISYRRPDNAENDGIINRFYNELVKQYGQGNVFFDANPNTIGAGDSNEQLLEAVRDSDFFIPIITKRYFEEPYPENKYGGWCYLESMEALNNGITIIPIVINGFNAELIEKEPKYFEEQIFNTSYPKVNHKDRTTHIELPLHINDEPYEEYKERVDRFRSKIYYNLLSFNRIYADSILDISKADKIKEINQYVCESFANKDNVDYYIGLLDYITSKISKDQTSEQNIDSVFVEVGLKKEYTKYEKKEIELKKESAIPIPQTLKDFVNNIGANKYSVLIGEAGQGKSMMLKKIYIELSKMIKESGLNKDIYFPIYFEIKWLIQYLDIENTRGSKTLIKAMSEYIENRYNIKFPFEDALNYLLIKGKPLFMLDAMDEVSPSSMNILCEKIENEIPNACIVFSARPGHNKIAFDNEFVLNNTVVRKYHLDYLTKEQRVEYIDKIYRNDELANEFKTIINDKEDNINDYSKIDSIPFILFHLINNYNRYGYIPNTKLEVIDTAIDKLIRKDKIKDPSSIKPNNIKYIIGRVLFLNYVERDENRSLPIDIDNIANEYENTFHENSDKVKTFLENNLLINEEDKNQAQRLSNKENLDSLFSHELLANYYVGYYISNLLEKNKITDINQLKSLDEISRLASSKDESDWWKEITEATLCYLDQNDNDSKILIEPLLCILQEKPDYDFLCPIVEKFVKNQTRASVSLITKMLDRGTNWIINKHNNINDDVNVNPYEELYYYVIKFEYLFSILKNICIDDSNEVIKVIKEYLLINLEDLIYKNKNDIVEYYENLNIIKLYRCVEIAKQYRKKGYIYMELINKRLIYETNIIAIKFNLDKLYDNYLYINTGLSRVKIVHVKTNNKFYDSRENCNALIETKSNKLCFGCDTTVIPNSIKKIENHVFHRRTDLTKIDIPNNIEKIGAPVFDFCYSLEKINVDKNNQVYDSRNNCNAIIETKTNKLICGCKNTIIPLDVVEIGSYAFMGCKDIISINIPRSVVKIGGLAFWGCTSLKQIKINSNIMKLEEYIFSGCKNLESIIVEGGNKWYDSRENCNAIIETATNELLYGCMNSKIPQGVVTIKRNAFHSCIYLKSINIPSSVRAIEPLAFYDCLSLEKIYISDGVCKITSTSFRDCPMINEIIVDNKNTAYDSRNNCNAIIQTANDELIIGCINTIIPLSVKIIGEGVFSGLYKLKKIYISKNIWKIKESAFNMCNKLEDVYYGGSKVEWEQIVIEKGNEALLKANIHFNYKQ